MTGSKTAKKKKKKIDLGPEYRDPKNARHRISFWMDGDLLAELKKRTDEVGLVTRPTCTSTCAMS
jgi:hypothetical protein